MFLGATASLALGGLLTACSRSSGGGTTTGPSSANSSQPASAVLADVSGDLQIVKRFPPDALVPGRVRLPVSLADTTGVLAADGEVVLPATLTASVVSAESGKTLVDAVTATRHARGLSVPYWPFEFDVDSPGIYLLRVAEAPKADVAFQLMERKFVSMPLEGDPLPPFDTPTKDDSRGVEQICTWSKGICPFHDITLTEALRSGKPVAYLIGTPAYCSTGTCAPALEALMEVAKRKGDSMVFIHSDVYADKGATTAAPAVKAYNLSYEPILYLTDEAGTLVRRLDVVFDVDELASLFS